MQKNFGNENLLQLQQWLKVIAEPKRLMMLDMIIQGVQCNCDLGEALQMAPNLISHHLSILRDAGIVEVERDPFDARWQYYTINPDVLHEIRSALNDFLDPERVQPRKLTCGPRVANIQSITFEK